MCSSMAKGSRVGTGLVAAVLCWALQGPLAQGQCGGGGGPQGGSACGAPEAKVTLARIVEADGKVRYQTFGDGKAVDRRQKALTDTYQKTAAVRAKADAVLTAKGLKNETVAPVEPSVEVVKKDITKATARATIKDARDWAVYAIETPGGAKHLVAYAHNDAFVRAVADAEFAKVYNAWVKEGSKAGQEPQPFAVKKMGEPKVKAQAETAKAQAARECSAQIMAKPTCGS